MRLVIFVDVSPIKQAGENPIVHGPGVGFDRDALMEYGREWADCWTTDIVMFVEEDV